MTKAIIHILTIILKYIIMSDLFLENDNIYPSDSFWTICFNFGQNILQIFEPDILIYAIVLTWSMLSGISSNTRRQL